MSSGGIEMSHNDNESLVNQEESNNTFGSQIDPATKGMLLSEREPETVGGFDNFFDHDTSVEGVRTSSVSEQVPLSTPVMMRQQGCAIIVYTMVSYVIPTTLNELFIDQKSLGTLLFGAFVVSFTLSTFKYPLNASDHLKKDFNLYWGADAAQTVLLIVIACGFYFLHLGKDWSPVGYNAAVTVPGIALKLLTEFVLASAAHKYLDENHFVNKWLLPKKNDRVNEHKYSLRHYLALQIPFYCLLFSALIAGSEVFATMKVAGTTTSVGEALVTFFKLCGAKAPATLYSVAMMFNEVVGTLLLMGTGWFPDVHWSFFTRIVTTVVMAAIFEALSTVLSFLTHENIVTLWFSMTMTFLADRAVQYTIGPKTDKFVNYVVYTQIGEPIQKGVTTLMSKCGIYPYVTVLEEATLNPVLESNRPPV